MEQHGSYGARSSASGNVKYVARQCPLRCFQSPHPRPASRTERARLWVVVAGTFCVADSILAFSAMAFLA